MNDDPDYTPKDTSLTKIMEKFKKQESMLNLFWSMWKDEYLKLLQERKDYKHPSSKSSLPCTPQVGEIVLLKENGISRGFWKTAKVTKLNFSQDGKVRSAEILTQAHRTVTRPLNLLLLL